MSKYSISLLVLLIVMQTNISNAQNKINGYLNGLDKVHISILGDGEKSTLSNSEGEFVFNNIVNGNYTIEFSHIAYKQKTISVEVYDNDVELNIVLEKKIIILGEALVVSSRSKISLKDISLPIELINSKKLEATTLTTISDLMEKESGVSVVRDGPWATTANIRGLSGQNIVYLIDGNRIETSTNISAGLSLIDINDLESVEIVKGGISSLYGTGATGGVINIQSKDSPFSENTYLNSEFVNGYNSVNNSYSNYLNFKLGANNWSAKINGSFRKADDTNIPNGKLKNSSFQDESFNANINYAPIEDLIIKAKYQKFSAFDVGIPGGAPFPISATAKYNYAKRELFTTSVGYKNVSKSLINTRLNFYHQIISRSVEIKPNALVTANPIADHTTNGLSFKSDWFINENNSLIAGIDYWQREYEGIRTVTNLAKNVISVDKPVPNSKFKSLGFFAKDDIQLSNKLSISLSARYDFINITNEETKNPQYQIVNDIRNDNVRNELASYESYDENNKSISGSFGSIYEISENYDLVFNAGYNFRSPSLEERYQYINLGGITYLGNPDLESEEGIFLDLGFRIWEENLSVRFNTFLNSFSNLVINDVLYPDSIYIKNNVGEARLFGFDTRIDYNFYKDYLVYVSAAYVKGEDITTDADLPQIAPLNGTLGIVVPIKDLFNIDLSASLSSNQDKVGLGENQTSGFAKYDIRLTSKQFNYGFINLKVVAGVENIFNREYREHLSTYRGIELFEPGRNIFAKLIFNFE